MLGILTNMRINRDAHMLFVKRKTRLTILLKQLDECYNRWPKKYQDLEQ